MSTPAAHRWTLLRWPVIALVVAAAGFVGWSFRPSPTMDGDAASGTPAARPLLLDATPDGALVQVAGASTPTEGAGAADQTVVAWAADGQRRWTSKTLAERVLVVCGADCSTGYGSATLDSLSRPEVPDPRPVLVTSDGEQPLSDAPRARVLWAGASGERIEATAAQLGRPLQVVSVAAGKSYPLATDARGDALVLVDGDKGMLLTHPTVKTAVAIPIARHGSGWRAAAPVTVPAWEGGCFAVRNGTGEAVLYSALATTLVTNGRASPMPGITAIGACAIDASGPLLAEYDGSQTRLTQTGDATWTVTLSGTRSVSANAMQKVAVASDDQRGSAAFLRPDGSTLSVVTAYGARVLPDAVVLIDRAGTPAWRPMP